MMSVELHVNIHACAAAVAEQSAATFDRTFEQVAEALGLLPRMFVEPDGSFVWVSAGERAWQLDGVLYDGAGRLWYVELKGGCPEAEFDRLLTALGWPKTSVCFQLVREAAWLDEPTFRRYAGWVGNLPVRDFID